MHSSITAFLAAVNDQDLDRARSVLRDDPSVATSSLHVAAALGLADDARRLIDEDPTLVNERVGNPPADPLLFLGFSPFHGETPERDAGLLTTARLLLDAGADPNTREARHGVPVLYAVTGMRSVLPIARLLLERGAHPTDGESVFHAAEHFHEDALELLLASGADLNHVGEWGNTPIYFLLRWWDVDQHPRMRQGLTWLLEHGADPDVRCGREQETALHVAARRGQSASIVRELLDHGADVHARRGDGSTPWLLARRHGFDEIASLLEAAGATPETLTPRDVLIAACNRGDADAARQLTSPALLEELRPEDHLLFPEAASVGRDAAAMAYLAAGFPIDTKDSMGATALHHAAIHGHADLVRSLLAAGSDIDIRDGEHRSTPLGWACFGADFVADARGDYPASVRALLGAGARWRDDEYSPRHEGVRAELDRGAEAK